MTDQIVIVGAGLAATRADEAIRENGHAGPVLLLGAEHAWPYQRPARSKEVLTAEGTFFCMRCQIPMVAGCGRGRDARCMRSPPRSSARFPLETQRQHVDAWAHSGLSGG